MKHVHLLKERVLAAALAWWRMHRPLAYSEAEHIANPTINTTSESEKKLARAVAALLKESWRKDDATTLVRDLLSLARDLDGGLRTSDHALKKHETYRRAEAFLGEREVSDDTKPRTTSDRSRLGRLLTRARSPYR